MNKEITTLVTRALQMINGLLAITYIAGMAWLAVQVFHMIF